MTLLLTEIHWGDNLLDSFTLFAADRRISRSGVYDGIRKKIFKIPYLQAGIGYFGLAEVNLRGKINRMPMSDWLLRFIRQNSSLSSMEVFANDLARNLNSDIMPACREKYISGFHLSGFNSAGLPEFWYVRNVEDDSRTITGSFEAREDFIDRHASEHGYDGQNPETIRPREGRIYRNGDIRSHVKAWEKIDECFSNFRNEPKFKKPTTIEDYEEWVKFKLEVIAYFYKKYCKISLIARPVDTFIIKK